MVRTKELFKEAFICYKASAYRAAFLFSYLGFMMIVRKRILEAECPSHMNESQWLGIQENARNDDAWDKTVFDQIQAKNDSNFVFILTDDLRNQVKFFKYRRNDCAHGKDNEISSATVDVFWLFIRSNLSKFVVSGSEKSLINQIEDHFDRSITPPGKDLSYVISEIPYAIESANMIAFFDKVQEIALLDNREGQSIFFNDLFTIQDSELEEKLVDYLQKDDNFDLLLNILQLNPSRIIYFADNPQLIRKLWYDSHPTVYNGKFKRLPLFFTMLTNNLIPSEQIDEANKKVLSYVRGSIEIDGSYRNVLEDNGFFDAFREYIIEGLRENRFDWSNSRKEMIVEYIEKFGIDNIFAEIISKVFSDRNHPWHLREHLNTYFEKNPERLTRMREIIRQQEYEPPVALRAFKGEYRDEFGSA